MMDMLSFFTDEMVTATWTAGAAGTYTLGEWVPAYAAGVSIPIVFPQPLTQEQLQQLPQGERVRNFVQTWTKSDIAVRDHTTDSDTITYDGKTYLVHQIGDRIFPGNFKNVILREKTADE